MGDIDITLAIHCDTAGRIEGAVAVAAPALPGDDRAIDPELGDPVCEKNWPRIPYPP